ncbi:MAG: hypothetical protein AMJ69_04660 [Gammaproteobacteria bacterium SG8_47]|nr:MAG: hypothetical protein AMJ69_04660 [Gammaproteobacteria bacterium SG8_47]
MNAKRIVLTLIATMAVTLPMSVWAGGESGLYVGAGFGTATVDGSVPEVDTNFKGSDSAYKLIVGYNFGVVPLIDLGVEASYVDFGKIDDNSVSYEQTAFDGFGLAGLTFGPFAVFGKAGLVAWDAKLEGVSDSGTDAAYGVGVRLQIASISARLEYERFDLGDVDDMSMTSLSLLYTF